MEVGCNVVRKESSRTDKATAVLKTYFLMFLCLYFLDRTAEEWTGRERENDMQQRATGGIEAAAATLPGNNSSSRSHATAT